MSQPQPSTDNSTRAATDVPEFLSDLDAGVLEHMLSIALSQTAAAVIDHDKKGEVRLAFKFEQIKGTHQVRIAHDLKFTRPTGTGRSSEETGGATVLHVGPNGRLSLAQPSLLERDEKRQHRLPD